jgi:large subunit ribosomal protein L6
MSKIGKKPIVIPKGTEIKISGNSVTVKGPKGELKKEFSDKVLIKISEDVATVELKVKDNQAFALWGLTRALLANMIKGVTEGFETVLEFQGVGYKAAVKGEDLEMGLGFSHPVTIKAPKGITFKTEKNSIRISGIDNEVIGETASRIRVLRKPEPYKGSGIRYQGEVLRKKAGKKAVAAGA